MKNCGRGFIIPVLIAIVAILTIGGEIYYKKHQDTISNIKPKASLQVGDLYQDKNINIFTETNDFNIENNPGFVNKISNIKVIDEIKDKNFELLQSPNQITFGDALDVANHVSLLVKIRPAFLLAITQEELNLEKTDMCYLTNLKTGEGIRATDGKVLQKTMNVVRDIPDFLEITKELGKDPLKTLVTCPMSFGWGGAMGPADFIPSTWMLYKKQIENITGKSADPWSTSDAFLAAGLFLSDVGAKSKTYSGEWKAAMVYFSGSANSSRTFYADGAMKIAEEIQKDIEIIEKK